MWTRQVETREQAIKEMAEYRDQGKKVVGPVQVLSPNGRLVWAYSVEI